MIYIHHTSGCGAVGVTSHTLTIIMRKKPGDAGSTMFCCAGLLSRDLPALRAARCCNIIRWFMTPYILSSSHCRAPPHAASSGAARTTPRPSPRARDTLFPRATTLPLNDAVRQVYVWTVDNPSPLFAVPACVLPLPAIYLPAPRVLTFVLSALFTVCLGHCLAPPRRAHPFTGKFPCALPQDHYAIQPST